MKSAEWPASTAWCSRFFVSMVLPSPCAATRTTFSPLVTKSSEKTRSTVGRWSCLGQSHSKSASGFEAAEPRRLQLAFEPPAGAGVEFGLHEAFRAARSGLQRARVARAIEVVEARPRCG